MLAILGSSTLSALKTGVNLDYIALGVGIVAFIASRKIKVNPVIIILASGIVGGLLYYFV